MKTAKTVSRASAQRVTSGYSQVTYAAPIGTPYANQIEPESSGLVNEAAELAACAIGEVRTLIASVKATADRLLGTEPECASNEKGVGVASGRSRQVIGNLNELREVLVHLQAQINRLDAL